MNTPTPDKKWANLPDRNIVDKTVEALRKNGIDAIFVSTGKEAKQKLLELIPKGSSVTAGASVTLETIGVKEAVDESGDYTSNRKIVHGLDKKTQGRKIRELRSVADYAIGSVHAITQGGSLMIASKTGSQLPSYAFGADHVIWVAGTQKIVTDIDEGMKRIYEYCLPKEDVHMHQLYNVGSAVNKILIVNKEPVSGRATLILVNEVLGF